MRNQQQKNEVWAATDRRDSILRYRFQGNARAKTKWLQKPKKIFILSGGVAVHLGRPLRLFPIERQTQSKTKKTKTDKKTDNACCRKARQQTRQHPQAAPTTKTHSQANNQVPRTCERGDQDKHTARTFRSPNASLSLSSAVCAADSRCCRSPTLSPASVFAPAFSRNREAICQSQRHETFPARHNDKPPLPGGYAGDNQMYKVDARS